MCLKSVLVWGGVLRFSGLEKESMSEGSEGNGRVVWCLRNNEVQMG